MSVKGQFSDLKNSLLSVCNPITLGRLSAGYRVGRPVSVGAIAGKGSTVSGSGIGSPYRFRGSGVQALARLLNRGESADGVRLVRGQGVPTG